MNFFRAISIWLWAVSLASISVGQLSAQPATAESSNGTTSSNSPNAKQASTTSSQTDCVSKPTTSCDLNATIADIAPPDSPAFSILGVSPTNVSQPTSLTSLAADAINAFDQNGHFQSGSALDASPFLLFFSRSYSLGEYADHGPAAYFTRLFSRTGVSFATIKGTSSPDTSLRMSTGVRLGILDLSDPRAGLQTCLDHTHLPAPDPNNPDASEAAAQAAAEKCRTSVAKKAWNSTSFVIAGAPAWISTDGSTSNMKLDGGGAWATLGLAIKDWGQIVITARRETGQQVVPPSSSTSSGGTGSTSQSFVVQDSTVYGGDFKIGKGDINLIVTGLYIGKRTAGTPDSYPELGIGFEREINSNLYLDLNYRYDVSQTNSSGVLANLKWSFNQKPQLAPNSSSSKAKGSQSSGTSGSTTH